MVPKPIPSSKERWTNLLTTITKKKAHCILPVRITINLNFILRGIVTHDVIIKILNLKKVPVEVNHLYLLRKKHKEEKKRWKTKMLFSNLFIFVWSHR